MSLTTLHQSTQDQELIDRIVAAAFQEAHANEELGNTPYGQTLQNGGSSITVTDVFLWPIAIDNRDAYAYAVESGNEHPGQDPGVISDASISTAIQTYWPTPPAPAAPTATFTVVGMQGQVTVTGGTPAATYTVEWGDGAPGALPIDPDGGAFAGHDYAASGVYEVRVLDDTVVPIPGSTTLTVPGT